MRLFTFESPSWIRKLYPNLVWEIETEAKNLYLSFDDGPNPEVTPYVLDQLDKFNAKATFFMIGEQIQKHPLLVKEVLSKGHLIGNHSMSHMNGWRTENHTYAKDVNRCQELIIEHQILNPPIFRPPYGRISFRQANMLSVDYNIIMWSYVSGDFHKGLSSSNALKRITQAKSGSIIVFHDNHKFVQNLKRMLPSYLEEMANRGYNFEAIQKPQIANVN